MPDGSIIFEAKIDEKVMERDLARSKRKILSITDSIYRNEKRKLPLIEQSKELSVILDQAKAKLFEMQNAPKGTFDTSSIKEQQAHVRGLQTEYNRIENEIDSINRKLETSNIDLDLEKERAGQLQMELAKSASDANRLDNNTKKSSKAMQELEKRTHRFGSRMREIVSGALFFNLISRGIHEVVNWMGTMIKSNDEARESIAQLKGALLTLAQPILNVVIPAFTALVNILTRVVSAIASIVSRLFGTTAKQSAEAAKNLNNQAEGYSSVEKKAKDAAKSLMAFDELNILQGESDSTGTSSGTETTETITPKFDSTISDDMQAQADKLTAIVSGAAFAIGAILAFSGANIPLGIGMMATGALGMYAAASLNWDSMSESMQNAITSILVIVGTALLAIGAILAFSGAKIGLGIGLMALGAASLAAAVALNWDSISNNIQDVITVISAALGAALLVLGALFAFSGVNVPLGIGMMIAGGALLLAATVIPHWNYLYDLIKNNIDKILAILGAALLALGAILAFSGANVPLGIGLILLGAASIGGAIALNWDSVTKDIKKTVTTIASILGVSLLVLGALLTFTGVNPALGIGLMIAGGVALLGAGAANLDWNFILTKLKEVWGNIKSWFTANVSPMLTLEYWENKLGNVGVAIFNIGASIKEILTGIITFVTGVFTGDWDMAWSGLGNIVRGAVNGIIGVINALISGSVAGVNLVSQALNSINFSVPNWVPGFGGMSFGFNLPTLTAPQIPYLAQGAVIPPNREFLAVLGDQTHGNNVEAPESLIRQIVREESGNISNDQLVVIVELIRQILALMGNDIDIRTVARMITTEQSKMQRAGGY